MSSKRYPEEFKIEAVKQITERGYPTSEVSARLGVSKHSLYAWVKEYSHPTAIRIEVQGQQAELRSLRAGPVGDNGTDGTVSDGGFTRSDVPNYWYYSNPRKASARRFNALTKTRRAALFAYHSCPGNCFNQFRQVLPAVESNPGNDEIRPAQIKDSIYPAAAKTRDRNSHVFLTGSAP